MISHLSFTRIKKLLVSPESLHRYIMGLDAATDAMSDGNLLDCLVFEPEKFAERFEVLPDGFRRPTAAQINAKKPTDETLALIEKWNEFQSSGKTLVKQDDVDDANRLADCVRNNSTVVFHGLLNDFKYQVPCQFEYKGFAHKGVKDAEGIDRIGNKVIWDLKRMGATCGEQLVRWQIKKMGYDLQAAIYCHEYDRDNIPVKYYVIAIDNFGNVTPFEITKSDRMAKYPEWHKATNGAHRLNLTGEFNMSCEFWANNNGFFKL